MENVELYHHGIKGQKWGVRRYQNSDGTLTDEGRKRYSSSIRTSISVPKGSIAYRAVVLNSDGSYKFRGKDYTFVDMTDDYMEFNKHISEGFGGRFTGEVQLKTTKNLKIASPDDYMNAFLKSYSIDTQVALNKIPKDVTDRGNYFLKNYRDITGIGYVDGDRYEGSNNEAFLKVIKTLKDFGFDGCIDPVDWKYVKDAKPMIVFDPGKNLQIESVDKW